MISSKSTTYLNINEVFVTDGGEPLVKFREEITRFSLNAASSRLFAEKRAKMAFSLPAYKADKNERHENHFEVLMFYLVFIEIWASGYANRRL